MDHGKPGSETTSRRHQLGPDQLQQLWRTETLPFSTAAALSGDGKVLLTCSGQTFRLRSTGYGKAIRNYWEYEPSTVTGTVGLPLLALDYLGETAVVVFLQKTENDAIYDIDLKIYRTHHWQIGKYPILVKSRNIKSVAAPRSLSISPFSDFVAFISTLSNGRERIEMIQFRRNNDRLQIGDGYFLVRGERRPLDRSQACKRFDSVCFTRDSVVVAISDFKRIYLQSLPLISSNSIPWEFAYDEGCPKSLAIDLPKIATPISICEDMKIGHTPIKLKFLPDRNELVVANDLWIAVYRMSAGSWTTHSFSTALLLDHWAFAVIRDRLIVTGNGLLRILRSQDLSFCRELQLHCAFHPHWLTVNQDSLIIIAWENETFTCYTVPFHLKQSTAREGPVPDISDNVLFTSERAGGGGFGDVFKGLWNMYSIEEPPPIAIKVLREPIAAPNTKMAKVGDEFPSLMVANEALQQHAREIEVWRRLEHKHIVPFVGKMSTRTASMPALISEWMPNGTVKEFLERYPFQNPFQLIDGIAKGLEFLHHCTPVIVHGDMKAANVLIDEDGTPRITDFGISRLLEDSALWNTSKTSADGSTRWMASELINGTAPRATVESDIYAFAMTILEILTGEVPYAKVYSRNEQVIINVVLHGARPQRPHQEVFSDPLWKLLEQCWNSDPKLRGSIDEVADKLIELQENSLKILSIDHSFSSMVASLTYLQMLEVELIAKGLRVSEQFDLICGSSFGGFIAILLGIFGLDVEYCFLEYWGLAVTFQRISSERDMPERLFHWGSSSPLRDSTAVKQYLESMIKRHGLDPQTPWMHFRFNRPRVLLVSDDGFRRSYLAAGADMILSDVSLLDAIMGTLTEPSLDMSINPNNVVFDEIERLFGRLTKVGCFITCGLTEKLLPWGNFHPPPGTTDDKEGVIHRITRIVQGYYRFDAMKERKRLLELPNLGRPLVRTAQDWDIIPTLRFISQQYMDLPEQKRSLLECVDRLRGPAFKIRNRLFEGEKTITGDGEGFETGVATSK